MVSAALATSAAAPAAAQQRCEGTLCDWFYGSSPQPAAPQPAASQAGATPLTVPSTSGFFKGLFSSGAAQPAAASQAGAAPAPEAPSRVRVGGGGLAAMARGETSGHCSGTLCDMYYGSSASEPEEQAQAASSAAAMLASPTPETADEGTRQRIRFRQAELAEEAKPRCATTPGDPWKCYR